MMGNTKEIRLGHFQRCEGILASAVLVAMLFSTTGYAQKGMGDHEGMARKAVKPPIVRISGILQEIRTHPCERTTGRALIGTHLILKDSQNREFNIHLGPTVEVADIVKRLSVGKEIEILVFRTEKMPADHRVATTLILGGRTIQLRDSMLRPSWSRSGRYAESRGKNRRMVRLEGQVGVRYGSGRWRRCQQRRYGNHRSRGCFRRRFSQVQSFY